MKPAALIVPDGLKPENIPFIEVDDPKLAFIQVLEMFAPKIVRKVEVHDGAYVNQKAQLGDNVSIMPGAVVLEDAHIDDNSTIYPNCVIEEGAKVGKNTILYSGVILRERCIIGDDCIVHSGCVIGADGYGFYEKEGEIIKIPQIGKVVIGDRVEIGSNCCIDRATVGSTEVGNDTKLDNMVHIAHNVNIGEKCYIIAQTGISGSVEIGDRVTIAGQVGIADHVSIAAGTIIMAQSGIHNNIKKPDILFGTPARPVKEHHRIHASLKFLPDLLKRVKKIEGVLEEKGIDSQNSDN
jgi:UDP-3-O-[3-hydroxymyristoyl] glucosamine N-acyltransferase